MFVLIVWFSSFSSSSRQCRVARISGRFGPVAISLVCVSEIIKPGNDGFPCHDTQTNQNRNHRKVFFLFVHEIRDNWNTTEVAATQCLVNHSLLFAFEAIKTHFNGPATRKSSFPIIAWKREHITRAFECECFMSSLWHRCDIVTFARMTLQFLLQLKRKFSKKSWWWKLSFLIVTSCG